MAGWTRDTIAARSALLVAGLSCAVFLVLATVAASGRLFDIDQRVQVLVQHSPRPFWDLAMRDVSLMGSRYGLMTLMAVCAGLLWRTRRPWAAVLPVLMAGTGALQLLAKWAVNRPRPNQVAWGFPSGHVLSLVVLFGLMGYILHTAQTRRSWQHLGMVAGGTAVVTVAFSRLYLEAHWFSDVAGGFLLGLAYLLVSIWLVNMMIGGHARRRPEIDAAPPPIPPAGVAVDVPVLTSATAAAGID